MKLRSSKHRGPRRDPILAERHRAWLARGGAESRFASYHEVCKFPPPDKRKVKRWLRREAAGLNCE